jgi:hypothetical protein
LRRDPLAAVVAFIPVISSMSAVRKSLAAFGIIEKPVVTMCYMLGQQEARW